jgi:site-specific recombinase XerD
VHSITAYQKDLETFWEYANKEGYTTLNELNHLVIRSWLVSLMESGMDARSVNRKISTLKSYYKFLIREGKVELNPMAKIISPRTAKKLPVFVDKTHMENLFDFVVFEPGFEGHRNRMVLLLFYQTGMRLSELTGLKKGDIDFICLNFANADMVGHTGVIPAAIKAVEAVDNCLGKILEAGKEHNYSFIIIADHGNADVMLNEDGSSNTAHSKNPVPVILVDDGSFKIDSGRLCDIAPTILDLLQIEKPALMTGHSLLIK